MSNEIEQPAGCPADADTMALEVADRRRPDRDEVSPELIPLFRHAGTLDMDEPFTGDEEDGTPSLAGVPIAVAMSLPLWAVIAAAVWLVR